MYLPLDLILGFWLADRRERKRERKRARPERRPDARRVSDAPRPGVDEFQISTVLLIAVIVACVIFGLYINLSPSFESRSLYRPGTVEVQEGWQHD